MNDRKERGWELLEQVSAASDEINEEKKTGNRKATVVEKMLVKKIRKFHDIE